MKLKNKKQLMFCMFVLVVFSFSILQVDDVYACHKKKHKNGCSPRNGCIGNGWFCDNSCYDQYIGFFQENCQNNVDDNCNGQIDEGCVTYSCQDANNLCAWKQGNELKVQTKGSGETTNGGTCSDGIDNDCDGPQKTDCEDPDCAQASNCNLDPVGTLDSVDCNTASGWARDPNTVNAIDVHLYYNGPIGSGTFLGNINANQQRNDLPFADKGHGFSFNIPSNLKGQSTYTIYAYGINDREGNNPQLNNVKTLGPCCMCSGTSCNIAYNGQKCDGCNYVSAPAEVCDNLDNNCNGPADENNPCPSGQTCSNGICNKLFEENKRYIFATSQVFGANLGGLSGADQKCQAAAAAGGLPGTYKAYLESRKSTANYRVAHSLVPYYSPNSIKIAENWDGLINYNLLSSIKYDEYGREITSDLYAWKGYSLPTNDCGDWKNEPSNYYAPRGMITSTSKTGQRWNEAGLIPCSSKLRLYCIQNDVTCECKDTLCKMPYNGKICDGCNYINAPAETCDGNDNNCNGQPDDGYLYDCREGKTCSNGQCKVNVRGLCNSDSECLTGHCISKYCNNFKNNGETCGSGYDCKSFQCAFSGSGGVCFQDLPQGSQCTIDYDCVSRVCKQQKCSANKKNGQPCGTDHDCANICNRNVCGENRANGADCAILNECQNGFCVIVPGQSTGKCSSSATICGDGYCDAANGETQDSCSQDCCSDGDASQVCCNFRGGEWNLNQCCGDDNDDSGKVATQNNIKYFCGYKQGSCLAKWYSDLDDSGCMAGCIPAGFKTANSGESSDFGEYTPLKLNDCCGDDQNEYYPIKQVTGKSICCNSATDCVDAQGKCQIGTEVDAEACKNKLDDDCDGKIDDNDDGCCIEGDKNPTCCMQKSGVWLDIGTLDRCCGDTGDEDSGKILTDSSGKQYLCATTTIDNEKINNWLNAAGQRAESTILTRIGNAGKAVGDKITIAVKAIKALRSQNNNLNH